MECFPSGLSIPDGTAGISAGTERSKTLLFEVATEIMVSAVQGVSRMRLTGGLFCRQWGQITAVHSWLPSGCDGSLLLQMAEDGLLQLLGWVIILPSPPQ